ncbi:hypothetical protein BP00DRAFT_95306 [Aspergillus indologenus CBS 114.80]|uniref:Uncharacterized protein n=1 Tax=Aspergillus indologenus CBS 114.80 TaxID=1450541 RepID=A0A2V5INR1_9EURO|nr:hypothetical protein BP00DRAFT_95306 [Aspergillus indologenus CBS 114.80]
MFRWDAIRELGWLHSLSVRRFTVWSHLLGSLITHDASSWRGIVWCSASRLIPRLALCRALTLRNRKRESVGFMWHSLKGTPYFPEDTAVLLRVNRLQRPLYVPSAIQSEYDHSARATPVKARTLHLHNDAPHYNTTQHGRSHSDVTQPKPPLPSAVIDRLDGRSR